MELISVTPVLFLDEPTSGLSSYDSDGVVRLLKRLSKEGKTIIATIHQPSLTAFREFDNLIMIARDRPGPGAMIYFGPAYPDAIEFFDPEGARVVRSQEGKELSPEMVFTGLAKLHAAEWRIRFDASSHRRKFVDERSGTMPEGITHVGAVGALRNGIRRTPN